MAFIQKNNPFKKKDPNLKDYAKNPGVYKNIDKEDRGTITQTPTKWQKFKQNRKRRQDQLIDFVAPGVPQIKNLVNVTKEKLNKNK